MMTPRHTFTSYDQETGLAITERAKILLAAMLPGCTARRFDLPDPPYGFWPVELCFADYEPIVPVLNLGPSSEYYQTCTLDMWYKSMLRDPRALGYGFIGPRINMAVPLDIGPMAIASEMFDAIAKIDFAELRAKGSIERILAEEPRYPAPWQNFFLALCAVYLGKYDEARALLQDALKYADQKGRQYYATLGPEAETSLAKLDTDADLLRHELITTMDFNWAHFPIVSQ